MISKQRHTAKRIFDRLLDEHQATGVVSYGMVRDYVSSGRHEIREELRIGIITWIERTYHRRRRQARLGRLTPIEHETIMNPAVSLVA